MEHYYTSGEFARKANVSVRTIRYYVKQRLLKTAGISEAGYRLYTDSDFGKLQKILSLKYLGFSLDEIRSMTVNDREGAGLDQSLRLQMSLVKKKIEHLQLVEETLEETLKLVKENSHIDWNKILHLIHITNMEKMLVEQYKNGANLTIRIDLHRQYAVNPMGWFQWLFSLMDIKPGEKILELGCGNGQLWKENQGKIPPGVLVCLSDISEGMVQEARENLQDILEQGVYQVFDCRQIPKEGESFDRAAANHVLFYVKELDLALEEISRVLKPEGVFYCSAYGREHMKEISQLAKEFDSRIRLSEVNLYDVFGLENGGDILKRHFSQVEQVRYEDHLEVDDPGALMEYILSCHGNQLEYLSDRYKEFREFLEKKMEKKGYISITKMAGAFICRK